MIDLTTTYMGLTLKNPIVPSASPLSKTIEGISADGRRGRGRHHAVLAVRGTDRAKRLDDTSLEHRNRYAETTCLLPEHETSTVSLDRYLELIREAKAAVDIPSSPASTAYTTAAGHATRD